MKHRLTSLVLAVALAIALAAPASAHGTAQPGPAGIACTYGSGQVGIVVDNPIVNSATDYAWMAFGVYSQARGWLGYIPDPGNNYWRFSYANGLYPSYFYDYGRAQWTDVIALTVSSPYLDGYTVYQLFYWSDGHYTAIWSPWCFA